jgi:hypothetical protein
MDMEMAYQSTSLISKSRRPSARPMQNTTGCKDPGSTRLKLRGSSTAAANRRQKIKLGKLDLLVHLVGERIYKVEEYRLGSIRKISTWKILKGSRSFTGGES